MHDNFNFMEDVVSVVTEESEKENFLNKETVVVKKPMPSISYRLKTYYRLMRKNSSAYFRKHVKTQCADILYITDGVFANEYILEFQKRYPDKIFTVLVPHFGELKTYDKSIAKFDYFLQNKHHSATLYKYNVTQDNIQVYGIYSKIFSELEKPYDLYKIKNLIHYSICARLAAKKLNPDIIHAENIPFYLGQEFSKQNKKQFNVLQTIHDFNSYDELEPFWAAINCLNKNDLNKLFNDIVIRKNIAALFGIKDFKNFSHQQKCLEYLYQNFERYRKNFDINEKTNENILINRLNNRVLELYNSAFFNNYFQPMYFSVKESEICGTNYVDENAPAWMKKVSATELLNRGRCKKSNFVIAHPFDISNFRFYREYNKQYLIREFSEKQISSNFVDQNLFGSKETKIHGYLDSFYRGNLIFANFDNLKDNEIKIITNSVLKCFEFKKNIQVVFNINSDFENQYLKSFIDFLEHQPSLNGKWVFIEGDINIAQFMAAADIILFPAGNTIGIEDNLYTALQYGCIPVTTNNSICGKIVVDIFDNMKEGFGFKTSDSYVNYNQDAYTNTLLKAINFYVQNFMSWKILIENAMRYDSSWNNEILEEYNKLYDKLLEI